MSLWGNFLPRGPGGEAGPGAHGHQSRRDVQSPASPGETQVKPQSRESVKSVGTCRTEWVAVRNSGGERTDRHTGVHPGTRTQTAGACP